MHNSDISARLAVANRELAVLKEQNKKLVKKLVAGIKELGFQNEEKAKRSGELRVAYKELLFQEKEKGKRAAELTTANKELSFQNEEKAKRSGELKIANKKLLFQEKEKAKRAAELTIANKELGFQNDEKAKRSDELKIANKELLFQEKEKGKRAAELTIANKELSFQNEEKAKRSGELKIANMELLFQEKEKAKRAAELTIANKELSFQNDEKAKRSGELKIANKELLFQEKEKDKRAAELTIANKELGFQNEEKAKRSGELKIANKELLFQEKEKAKRAAELTIANKELGFQNEEKAKRSNELKVANKELLFQEKEKEKRATELTIAHKELGFQNDEKAKRSAELQIANKELLFQEKEKGKRAAELTIANKQILFQEEEKYKRAAEVIISLDELTSSEIQFRLMVSNIKDYAIFMLDKQGRVATWNSGAQRIKGYAKEEIIGKPMDIFYTQEEIDEGEPQRNLQMALKHGHFVTEGFRVRKDGSLFYANIVFTSIVDKTGKLYGFTKITKDITERKQAEEKLQRLASRLLLATESMQLGIWDWDITNKILSWDDYMYRIYNIDHTQFNSLYEEWLSRVHNEDRQRIDNDITLALEGKKDYQPEFRIVWADASVHYIKASGIIERDSTGNAIRMIGSNWDISEQKAAEKVKDKITADIVQRNTDLQQFSYIVSHNLRAPVANLLGITAIINDPSNGTDENNKMIVALSSSAKQLDAIIKDLNYILQVKREMTDTKEWAKFSEIVSNIKGSISNMIEKEQVEIKTDFAEVDTMFTLNGYLYSIFYNLISNSIKYRQPGTNPEIDIKSLKLNGKTTLIFKDNGLGIDLKKCGKHVFGLYKRFHTHADGKGMGLYIVKTQVEILGGKISIQSEINKGTEFSIEFGEDDLGSQ